MQKARKLKKVEKVAKEQEKARKRAQNAKSRKKLSKKRKIDAEDRVSKPRLRNVKVRLEPDRVDSNVAVSRVNHSTVIVNHKIPDPDDGSEISNQRATFIERRVNTEEFLYSLDN